MSLVVYYQAFTFINLGVIVFGHLGGTDMQPVYQCASENVVGRVVENEFVVVSLTTDRFFHFNQGTETLLDFFRVPRSIGEFTQKAKIADDRSESHYVADFCRSLVDNGILQEVKLSPEVCAEDIRYERPEFLREGGKKLSEYEFQYP